MLLGSVHDGENLSLNYLYSFWTGLSSHYLLLWVCVCVGVWVWGWVLCSVFHLMEESLCVAQAFLCNVWTVSLFHQKWKISKWNLSRLYFQHGTDGNNHNYVQCSFLNSYIFLKHCVMQNVTVNTPQWMCCCVLTFDVSELTGIFTLS